MRAQTESYDVEGRMRGAERAHEVLGEVVGGLGHGARVHRGGEVGERAGT